MAADGSRKRPREPDPRAAADPRAVAGVGPAVQDATVLQVLRVDYFVKEVALRLHAPCNGCRLLDLYADASGLGRLERLGLEHREKTRTLAHGKGTGIKDLVVFTRDEQTAHGVALAARARGRAMWNVSASWGHSLRALPAGPFDAVVCSGGELGAIAVSDHVQWRRALRILRNRVRPGGVVIATIIDTASAWRRTRSSARTCTEPEFRAPPTQPGGPPLFTLRLEVHENCRGSNGRCGALHLDVPGQPKWSFSIPHAAPFSHVIATAEKHGFSVIDARNYNEVVVQHWRAPDFAALWQTMRIVTERRRQLDQAQLDLLSLYSLLVLRRDDTPAGT
eukprot:TRINITY_DN71293_c0_g1_i1.p1 TRINITY_DN71293_c0_g1~~TRINITY_DN71293_c0_g1_i1.p1  ORF type:complete len:336 (+),score=64.67 TRINITY_DN71293_c0_g1_i1:106-1113(+)